MITYPGAEYAGASRDLPDGLYMAVAHGVLYVIDVKDGRYSYAGPSVCGPGSHVANIASDIDIHRVTDLDTLLVAHAMGLVT